LPYAHDRIGQARELVAHLILAAAQKDVCRTLLHCCSARRDLEVGEEGFAADVDEQTDGVGDGCRLGFAQCQGFGSSDGRGQPGPVDVELERDPFVGADVRARFVVPVRIQLAQPIEFPVGARRSTGWRAGRVGWADSSFVRSGGAGRPLPSGRHRR
jgi:hypothetical protein